MLVDWAYGLVNILEPWLGIRVGSQASTHAGGLALGTRLDGQGSKPAHHPGLGNPCAHTCRGYGLIREGVMKYVGGGTAEGVLYKWKMTCGGLLPRRPLYLEVSKRTEIYQFGGRKLEDLSGLH